MPKHPLAEVFGFPTDNLSDDAERYRNNRLCPYNNRVPNCTKSSIEHPLGVCSVFDASSTPVITCPVRFQEAWQIVSDAAEFFFEAGTDWTSLAEVTLTDRTGRSAGNIDFVLIAYDALGRVVDYGALEVQAVYISRNVRTPFEHYMEAPNVRFDMDWRRERNYPRPDYLSSSRKRLAPQLIYKGGILNAWKRKTAVALDRKFFATLPALEAVDKDEADIAWLVYDLRHDPSVNRYRLESEQVLYTRFEPALLKITRSEAGEEGAFLTQLQTRLKEKLARTEGATPVE